MKMKETAGEFYYFELSKEILGFVRILLLYCIVLYLRLFSNMGDKTHPFTISLYDTFMQKVRVKTAYRNNRRLLLKARV